MQKYSSPRLLLLGSGTMSGLQFAKFWMRPTLCETCSWEAHDLWEVNTEAEYREEVTAEALAPKLAEFFPKLDRVALGCSVGATGALLLFLATAILALKGGPVVGPMLGLLGHYLLGYTVTPAGAPLGLAYGFVVGWLLGWTFALLRNAVLLFYIAIVRHRAEFSLLRRFLEFV